MDLGIITTALSDIAKVVNKVKDTTDLVTTKSLSDVTKLTRVEPLTIISKDLINLEYMVDVNQSLLSLFAAYYLQAVSVLTTINNVEVVKVLDALNPNRDETGFLMTERLTSAKESIHTLVLENYQYALPGTTRIALEDDKEKLSEITTISNLSVGKLLKVNICFRGDKVAITRTVDITDTDIDKVASPRKRDISSHETTTENDQQCVTIPIAVRLMASVIPNSTITHILALKTEDTNVVERFHAWRSGRISFIKDLIFCQDLVAEHKKALIHDDTGTLQEIMRRVTNAKKYGLLTRNPSMVSASNLFVISEQVAKDIEQKLGGRLSNPRIRDKAFNNTYAMIIVVVDREWERVTFYIRGQAASADLSIKEITAANKHKGPDIMDLFRSMSSGMPVNF